MPQAIQITFSCHTHIVSATLLAAPEAEFGAEEPYFFAHGNRGGPLGSIVRPAIVPTRNASPWVAANTL